MMRHWLVLEALVLVLLAPGCAKQPATTLASAPAPTGATAGTGAGTNVVRTSEPGRSAAPQGSSASATAMRPSLSEFAPVVEVRDIHFDFDKYEIRPADAKILDADAGWLKANADRLILIEGHCDERGTNEYNLALGERRAKATLNYLASHGVAVSRMTVLSYGEERPVCTQHDEACWAKNRRAHMLVKRQ